MRARFVAAFVTLALAVALLAPSLAPLEGSMDAFAEDLSNGAFRPFGPSGGTPGAAARAFSGSLGGFTGGSTGDYLPGAADVPDRWVMDRDGRGGHVVIDYVFDPELGAMKRLKAFDRIGADNVTLEVGDRQLRPLTTDPTLTYDRLFQGSFLVQFRPDDPVPIFGVHPKAVVAVYSTSPRLVDGVTFLKDGADTVYAIAKEERTVTLNVTYLASSAYYGRPAWNDARASDYPAFARPIVPAGIAEDAKVVLARAGATDPDDVASTIDALERYFRSFEEGDIPAPSEVESLYLALGLGGKGCCRHRSFAFMATAQAAGVPTRVVVNEAHAFVEVMTPRGAWHQINLGGCGTYSINNPRNLPSFSDASSDPRREANPDEGRPVTRLPTLTNITDSPPRIVKGERYFVNGTVVGLDGRSAPGARVDVYLNETKEAPGRLTGAGVTDVDGRFSVEARVPRELPARGYQLVARSAGGGDAAVTFDESWSDPPVDVFAPTRFESSPVPAAVGFPVNVTARLMDAEATAGLPGASVRYAFEDGRQGSALTEPDGTVRVPATFSRTGSHTITFAFDGDDHHGPSAGNATVSVENGAVLVDDGLVAVRGEPSIVSGQVALGGVPLGGRLVRVAIVAPQAPTSAGLPMNATTNDAGRFTLDFQPSGATVPATYAVRVEVPSLGLRGAGSLRIAARPQLELAHPTVVGPGDDWTLLATLHSDDGKPITTGTVAFEIDGNASSARVVPVNRTGVARLDLAGGALPSGPHTVVARFGGDREHVAASSTARVDVALPWYAVLPWWAWLLPLGVALASGAVVGAVVALRRRGYRFALPRLERWRLFATHPDHGDLPPVWEPGERATLQLLAHDREGRPKAPRVLVAWSGGAVVARAGDRVPVPVGETDTPVRLQARGLARLWTPPTTLVLRVRPYRRAVEEGFVELRRKASLDPATTPGELVRAVLPRIPPPRRPALREAIALFEAADFSEVRVDRGYYHAFARARREIERALEVAPRA